jgi:tRNA A37 methylthiotransferase MiaB
VRKFALPDLLDYGLLDHRSKGRQDWRGNERDLGGKHNSNARYNKAAYSALPDERIGNIETIDLLLEGRTVMHAPEIDGKVFVNDVPEGRDAQPGQFYRCEITEAHDYDLVARII